MNESILAGSFMEPPSSKGIKGFHLRKRKRKIADFSNSPLNDSAISTTNLDMSRFVCGDGVMASEVKRKRSLSRMTSAISTPMAKMSSALQRSLSSARLVGQPSPLKGTPTRFLRSASSVSHVLDQSGCNSPALKRGTSARTSASKLTPYKPPQPTPNKQRPTRFWSDKYPDSAKRLVQQEVKLQESIYELACGEEDLVNDLQMIQRNYADPLLQLHILTGAETEIVFGKLRAIVPLHADLSRSLLQLRCHMTGISSPIGQVIAHWVESLHEPYVDYCSGLIRTKAFIDHKRETDKFFNDFLQRCLESGFSRKLDLWSYLDVPRSKLVKYPLLLRQVIKYSTSLVPTSDYQFLTAAVQRLEAILQRVDSSMAEAKCQFTISRLEWLDEAVELRAHAVRKAREELLDGTLKNNRGTKLECHLLDTVLILGRPSSRLSCLATVPSTTSLMSSSSSTSSLLSTSSAASYQQMQQQQHHQNGYHQNGNSHSPTPSITSAESTNIGPCGKRLQVYRTPIPVEEMVLEDLHPVAGQSSSFSESSANGGLNASVIGGGSKHGSFRSAFSGSSNSVNRNGFRVSFRQSSDGQAHTLFAPDEHSKRQWMAAIKKAITTCHEHEVVLHTDVSMGDNSFISISRTGSHFRPIIEGSSVSETDFVANCTIDSPNKAKRVYVQDGKVAKGQLTPIKTGLFQKHKRSPRIKSALSQTALESVMVGGAAKKIRTHSSARKLQTMTNENKFGRKSTPSLLNNVESMVVLSALGSSNSNNRMRRKSNPSPVRSASKVQPVVRHYSDDMDKCQESALRRQNASSGSLAAAAVGKRILKQQLKTQSTPRDSSSVPAFRSRTKSWGHLAQMGNASYHGDVYDAEGKLRRYNTRSATKKISKSMSDLLEL